MLVYITGYRLKAVRALALQINGVRTFSIFVMLFPTLLRYIGVYGLSLRPHIYSVPNTETLTRRRCDSRRGMVGVGRVGKGMERNECCADDTG